MVVQAKYSKNENNSQQSPIDDWNVPFEDVLIEEEEVDENSFINPQEIRRFLNAVLKPGYVYEIRCLEATLHGDRQPYDKPRTINGYFNNVEAAIASLKRIDTASGIYLIFNPCQPALLAHTNNRLRDKKTKCVQDDEIVARQGLLLDLDPDREGGIKGIPTTDAESQIAADFAQIIRDWLTDHGFPLPIELFSGNGRYLYYHIDLPANDNGLVERFLKGLGAHVDTEQIHVDKSVFNQARLMRIPGTRNAKGDGTEDRPHRMASIISIPDDIQIVTREQLEAIATPIEQPKQSNEKSSSSGNQQSSSGVDWLDKFIAKHGIQVKSSGVKSNGDVCYQLESCAWNPDHTDNCATLFVKPNGILGANCNHNSCEGKGWKDFRRVFEPDFEKSKDKSKDKSKEHDNEESDTSIIDKSIDAHDIEAVYKNAHVFARIGRDEYAVYKKRIKDVFGKEVNLNEIDIIVKDARKTIAREEYEDQPGTSLDALADEFAAQYGETWAFNALMSIWYQWTGTHWQDMQDVEAQKRSCVSLDRIVRDIMLSKEMIIDKISDLDGVVRLACIHCVRTFKQKSNLVNFKNGTLDINTGTLRAHDKNDELTYCLPYAYDEHGDWPAICAFLRKLFPDKYARQNFMVHVGLSLMGDDKMHFACAIIGPPRTGKSKALDLANMTCGLEEGQYSGRTLFDSEIEGKRVRFMQNKKRIVCVDELPAETLRNEETFKNMTAHSGVEMRGICKDDQINNRWLPKIFMAMNERPEYKDTTGAIKERLVPLLVGETIPREERDIHMMSRLKPELGGFSASCIRLAKAALKRCFYPLSGSMKSVINDMAKTSNPLKSFIDDNYTLDREGFMFTSDIYKEYKEYCVESGNKALSKANMSKELIEMRKGIRHKSARNPINGYKVERGLEGLRHRRDTDPIIEDDFSGDDLMLFVDDVDDMLTMLFDYRQHNNSTSEAPRGTSVDDVDDVSVNNAHIDTPTPFDNNLPTSNNDIYVKGGRGIPIDGNRADSSSTSSTESVDRPVELPDDVDDAQNTSSTRRQQSSTNNNWVEDFMALGKSRGYPEIPDLGLGYGMMQWNSFSLTHRIRIPDVIARFK